MSSRKLVSWGRKPLWLKARGSLQSNKAEIEAWAEVGSAEQGVVRIFIKCNQPPLHT